MDFHMHISDETNVEEREQVKLRCQECLLEGVAQVSREDF